MFDSSTPSTHARADHATTAHRAAAVRNNPDMVQETATETQPAVPQRKRCFVISPIGKEGTDVRRRANQVLTYVIEAVLDPLGYEVIRADRITDAGLINTQILDHIVNDTLVVADLTDSNPNVYYELAVRHALGKPFVQLCQAGQQLPFDVQGQRTIFLDHTDLDSVAQAKTDLAEHVKAVQDVEKVETPLSVTVDLLSLRSSGDPERQAEAQMLSLLEDVHRSVSRGAGTRSTVVPRSDYEAFRAFVMYLTASGQVSPSMLETCITSDTSGRHDAWVRDLQQRHFPAPDDPWATAPEPSAAQAGWSDEPPF